MDKSVPPAAAHILNFIYRTETGFDAPECYDVVYGHNEHKMPKPLTSMTLDEVEADGPRRTRAYGSSAAGAAQFMRDTMDKPGTVRDLEGEMGLTGKEKFSPDLQDRMAFHLLKRRGYEKFMVGTMSVTAFAKALAQEWASFPVLAKTKGAHRDIARGETYYAGDRLNKALVKPEAIEALLAEAKALKGDVAPVPAAREDRPEPNEAITDADTILKVQTELKRMGYTEVGDADGKMGKMTRTAILAFRNENDLPVVDYIDQQLLAALWTAKPRELATARVEAKPAEVREQVPEAKAAWWTKIGAWVMGVPAMIGAAISGVLDNLDGSRGYLEPVKDFAGDIPPWVWFLAVGGVALFFWQNSRKAEAASTEAFKTGERR